ncbi:chromosome partitioning protein ParB [Nodularia chucula]|uniref:chromosome partitioning protein ParB n=1 Tax=Nodularia chucula TaxID=3093667 RepID=UPI0039C5E10B
MIKFSLVDVKSISSDVPRSNFAEADLENLADMILESGGLIKPLVLKGSGLETYTVIDGHFEYYGAVRAKEKNPRQGEMVNACVILPKEENIIIKQASAIQHIDVLPTGISGTTNVESRLTNLELRLEKQLNELKSQLMQERQITDDKFKQLESDIPEKAEQNNPLNLLNTLDKFELSKKLGNSRISGAEKLAKAIVEARQKKPNKKFDDYRDVRKSVKGLGENGILTIIDMW